MLKFILGLAITLTLVSAAESKDFIVVGSTDPSLKTGQALDAGERVPLGVGHVVTLIRPSGEVITLRGGPGGAVLPGAGAERESSNFAAVQALFARPPSGRTFGARRGFCPGPEVLDNIDAIIRSDQAGCKADARAAFLQYLKSHGVSAEDADRLYANTTIGAGDDAAGQ